MKTKHVLISLLLLAVLILAACTPGAAPTETMSDKEMASENMAEEADAMSQDDSAMMDQEKDTMEDDSMIEEESMPEHSDTMEDDAMASDNGDEMMEDAMMTPNWFGASLVNVQTGETFTISDLEGKVVLVETMAIWCSNCFKQQGQVVELHNRLGERDDFISLGVDIDPNEDADALKAYIDRSGFTWWYTVAPTEVARELGQLYGDQFLNPPSTPMLIIDAHGEVHPLPFGIKSANDLYDALQPFLNGEM